jgi:hypothetical protein
MHAILKYPRTAHLSGSALQTGDEPDRVSMTELRGAGDFVFEEKVDGANSGISFSPEDGRLVLQSRGHSLDGGPREQQFNVLKQWARAFETDFRDVLGREYVLYGEWMAAKHSQFYDSLTHMFLSYDVYQRSTGRWLSTSARACLLDGLPIVAVHVVHAGWISDRELPKLVKPSAYKSPTWRDSLRVAAEAAGENYAKVLKETDDTDLAEGVYLKIENGAETTGRYKFIRPGFLQAVLDSGSHWAARPIIKNSLAPGVDMFAPAIAVTDVSP